MTSMIFYDRPVALNRERHRHLKLDTAATDFSFAAGTNSILLAASEIAEAAKDYPVVFIGAPGGTFSLAALLGVRDRENLFVDAQGRWASGTYLPAFVRRYPFVLAETEADEGNLTVCIDESSARLGDDKGEAVFGADGADTPLLQNTTAFLRLFHGEMQQTTLFAGRLAELGLLTARTIDIARGDDNYKLDGFYVVDQDKLAALDDAAALDLFRSGALYAVHAHLMSLSQAQRLAVRLDERLAAPAAT